MTSDKNNHTERPDLWLTETTTPGLLIQVHVNSGEMEPVFATAKAPRGEQLLTGDNPDMQTFVLEAAATESGDDQEESANGRRNLR